jgi:hypothetical protein
VKLTEHIKARGLCLLVPGLMSLLTLGFVGSASGASLLFIPHSGKYPYHFVGTGGKSKLETVGGKTVNSEKVDILALVTSPTLANVHIEFLKSTSELGSTCTNTSNSETILVNLVEHLGFADPGNHPAGLYLVPSGFEFKCEALGGLVKIPVKVRGSVIGTTTKPGLNEAATELTGIFNQSKGKQEFTSFLFGSTLLANQHQESSINEGAFEESGQSSEATTVKGLAGEGTFLLVSP